MSLGAPQDYSKHGCDRKNSNTSAWDEIQVRLFTDSYHGSQNPSYPKFVFLLMLLLHKILFSLISFVFIPWFYNFASWFYFLTVFAPWSYCLWSMIPWSFCLCNVIPWLHCLCTIISSSPCFCTMIPWFYCFFYHDFIILLSVYSWFQVPACLCVLLDELKSSIYITWC